MLKILILILVVPTVALAGDGRDSQPTSLDMYNAAIEQIRVYNSAKLVFKTNSERGVALNNNLLVDHPTDNSAELIFKRDSRAMMSEITQWQSKFWKNGSSSYVEEVYLNRQGQSSAEWSFRRRFLLVELAGRISAALERERQQRLEKATSENGGNPLLYRIHLM